MTDRPIPTCPVRGCENPQCEPLTLYVCDDDFALRGGSAGFRAWVIALQDRPTAATVRELIEAARFAAEPEPRPDWLCHGADPERFADCANCGRFLRLRAAIAAAEGEIR